MRIDDRLNLVIPVELPAGKAFVHSTPVSMEVFEANFMLVSKTFAAIYGEGLGAAAAPRIAAMLLRRIAKETGDIKSADALLAEVRRLSNVFAPTPQGWEMIPLEDALAKGVIPKEDASEVENAIVFFIVASAMHRRSDLAEVLDGATRLWGAQTSSSSCTDFRDSLPTSTAAAISVGTEAVSSVPQ